MIKRLTAEALRPYRLILALATIYVWPEPYLLLHSDIGGRDPGAWEPCLGQAARQTVLEAYEHQFYPLPLLADQLHFERDPKPPTRQTRAVHAFRPHLGQHHSFFEAEVFGNQNSSQLRQPLDASRFLVRLVKMKMY